MPSTRSTVACALALAVATAMPSYAAAKPKPKPLPKSVPLVVTDKAGDANGVNGQSHLGGGTPADADPSQSGPGQRTAADILSVALGRLDDGKAVLGLTAVFTLSAAPDQGTIYRVQASTPQCSTFWISYSFPLGGTPSASLRENCTGANVTTPLTASVAGSVITVKAPFSSMPKAVKVGTPLTGLFGETKGHAQGPAVPAAGSVGPTVPTIDDTTVSSGTYKVGS